MRKETPISISEKLRKVDFKLPGKETHIPLGMKPYQIPADQYQTYLSELPLLAQIFLEAYKLYTNIDPCYPFIWRFDFLATPNDGDENHSHKLLELNGTRPGGIWLLNKAKEAYETLGVSGNFWLPKIDNLGNFFWRLAQRNSDNHQLIGLGFTPGYVAEIEMPKLAKLLNTWAQENGYNLAFISGPRDSFSSEAGYVVTADGRFVSVFYENAALQEINGKRINFLFSQEKNPGTTIVNPPELTGVDNKNLMAVLSSDDNFRRGINPTLLNLVEKYLPRTFAISNISQLEGFIGKQYFLKITDGIRGSSGKGVYNLQTLNEKNFKEIKKLIEEGSKFVIQETIPPYDPWYRTSIIVDGQPPKTDNFFVDFDPYIISDGTNIEVIGALCRAKPEHPINISQGGALFGVVII